ncbi:MAG: NYN domain-containing protein [Elusimicrobia bacterium]|nr:NYN domain-containing protein [Candidatus Obscuribacterium magneticum]
MSSHTIIDGYNLLHSTRRWDDLPREARRLEFLRYLEKGCSTASRRNTVTVVFDGYAASLRGISLDLVQLVFSGGLDADTVIKERVADLPNPRDAAVVTSDRALRAAVRSLGAQVISCEQFLRPRKNKTAPPPAGKPELPSAEAITRDLKRLWKL